MDEIYDDEFTFAEDDRTIPNPYELGFEDYGRGTHWPPYGSAGEEYRRGWRDAEAAAEGAE